MSQILLQNDDRDFTPQHTYILLCYEVIQTCGNHRKPIRILLLSRAHVTCKVGKSDSLAHLIVLLFDAHKSCQALHPPRHCACAVCRSLSPHRGVLATVVCKNLKTGVQSLETSLFAGGGGSLCTLSKLDNSKGWFLLWEQTAVYHVLTLLALWFWTPLLEQFHILCFSVLLKQLENVSIYPHRIKLYICSPVLSRFLFFLFFSYSLPPSHNWFASLRINNEYFT